MDPTLLIQSVLLQDLTDSAMLKTTEVTAHELPDISKVSEFLKYSINRAYVYACKSRRNPTETTTEPLNLNTSVKTRFNQAMSAAQVARCKLREGIAISHSLFYLRNVVRVR